ncbi:hypothetical protein KEM48_000074 [Puccinia striiformis f. sp. tritici PST-130]|nr:hypothetical protein KEM48_000074 [Puccinia striiformis f. sp. tritici PST-130]
MRLVENPGRASFTRMLNYEFMFTTLASLSNVLETAEDVWDGLLLARYRTSSQEIKQENKKRIIDPSPRSKESKPEAIELEEVNDPIAPSVDPKSEAPGAEAPTEEVAEQLTAPEPTTVLADSVATTADPLPATPSSEVPSRAGETKGILTNNGNELTDS